ncbi:MAG: oligosaccharide flippase family protein [Spirulinaceae cyanobacterium]
MQFKQLGLLKTLARGTGSALVVQLLSLGIAYTSRLFLARWLGVKEYGIYEYVTALSLLLGFLAGLGFPNAVSQNRSLGQLYFNCS